MRMRNKPWARPELEACPYFIKDPRALRGHWREQFSSDAPFHVELGCGKGGFAAAAALSEPQVHFLAMDLEYKMLGVARRKIARAFEEAGREPDNLLLTACNIEQIETMLSPEDRVDRLYINFCNPWPRKKHQKHRLTHPRQLVQYRTFLREGGEIRFKTDDDGLFEDSIGYFEECGFAVTYLTRDLHASGFAPNIVTEHEQMFSDEGIPIKFLIAQKPTG